MRSRLLGGMTPREFLRRHWQKRALFVRAALPAAAATDALCDEAALASLARRDDVESRMVERHGRRWDTVHGPFRRFHLKRENATLLVSGVNLHLAAAERLLRRFDFIPQARLDDLMVSFATPGGGVGPHVDSYDVFLLQGRGRRAWRVWDLQRNPREYTAGPGDLLYLPPGWKHDGVALEPCFTFSVGFRAPRGAELGVAFLDFLHERGLPDASYRDPGLAATRAPARIPRELLAFAARSLGRIRWSRADVVRFLGEYLTMPKPQVVFRAHGSRRPLAGGMVRLAPATQLLYTGKSFFINGETAIVAARHARVLRELADRRALAGERIAGTPLAAIIAGWQRLGYLSVEAR